MKIRVRVEIEEPFFKAIIVLNLKKHVTPDKQSCDWQDDEQWIIVSASPHDNVPLKCKWIFLHHHYDHRKTQNNEISYYSESDAP